MNASIQERLRGFYDYADYQDLRGNHDAAEEAREDARLLLERVALDDPNGEVEW